MTPRNPADYRTLLWLALGVVVLVLQFTMPAWRWYLTPLSFYFALASGIIAHNHNHNPVFANRRMNHGLGHLLSFFYGYPTFAWIPTHNLNHHRHVNKEGDATITWRFSDRHNLFVATTYFFVSSYYQAAPIQEYIRQAKLDNRPLYRRIVFQYSFWIITWAALFVLAIAMYGLQPGFRLWCLAVGLPSLFTLWAIMLFNYEQHVHTDPWSEHNHSRNFTSKVLNWLLFNNGYHGVHHEHPGMHWSRLPEAHKKVAHLIDPALIHRSMWGHFARQFLLAPLVPSVGTKQVGRSPYDTVGG
jgi:fatty acid desaturase